MADEQALRQASGELGIGYIQRHIFLCADQTEVLYSIPIAASPANNG